MSNRLTWQERCRAEAQASADAEARARFGLTEDEPIPFSHRWEHVQRVVQMALWLADKTDADRDIVEAAAWLHDICKSEPNHGKAGAAAAEALLNATDFPPEKIPAVVDAIARHVGLTREPDAAALEPLETAVLWDADKLTKLGVNVLAYTLSLRQFDGMTLTARRQELSKFTRKVLSKTVKSMNTAPASYLAQERYQAMSWFLEVWESEETL
ncbi:MAG: HD domain-containing protein [Caldilineaceae bacterium]|jgi:uncharacterized protein|nr:HD domain-containing protein [Caldilineaceae bacterium]